MKPRSRKRGPALFVTVGSTRFDKLINNILKDECISFIADLGFTKLTMQVGQSEYDQEEFDRIKSNTNRKLEIELYKYKSSLEEDIERADLIIGHAGAGTCLEVLRANKRLLLVVNETLMDNHQNELADQLAQDNYVVKTTTEDLLNNLEYICNNDTKLAQFPPRDSSKFEAIFDEALRKVTSRL